MLTRRDFMLAAAASLVAPYAHAEPARRLLFVHGRGQQGLDPVALKAEWMATLERGAAANGQAIPPGLDVAFPFYGDALDRFARQFDIPLTSEAQPRGSAQDNEYLAFQAQFAEAVRQRAGVTDAQVDAEYGDNPKPRGPLNWEWVQAILRAVDKHGPGMSQKTLELFTRDVFLYTTRAGVREEIDGIVAAALTEEPTVVVGHSLGTVVAYSVLRGDRRTLKVAVFVTVGSPLGVRAVRDQFRPLRSPRPVAGWYNAFDTRDVVALYPLDADNFPVQPAIDNYDKVKNSTDNHHGIVGYLDNPEVAKRILGGLG